MFSCKSALGLHQWYYHAKSSELCLLNILFFADNEYPEMEYIKTTSTNVKFQTSKGKYIHLKPHTETQRAITPKHTQITLTKHGLGPSTKWMSHCSDRLSTTLIYLTSIVQPYLLQSCVLHAFGVVVMHLDLQILHNNTYIDIAHNSIHPTLNGMNNNTMMTTSHIHYFLMLHWVFESLGNAPLARMARLMNVISIWNYIMFSWNSMSVALASSTFFELSSPNFWILAVSALANTTSSLAYFNCSLYIIREIFVTRVLWRFDLRTST